MEKEIYIDFAWECLRRNKHYIEAWEINKKSILTSSNQNILDLIAEKRWGLLKFVNPSNSSPEGVFWSSKFSKKSLPIIFGKKGDFTWGSLKRAPGLKFKKLQLLDGSSCIKIFNQNDYFQFFVDGETALTEESEISLYMPISLNNNILSKNIDVIKNILNNNMGCESYIKEGQQNDLLETIDGLNKGFSHRTIASLIFGEKVVEREWSSDSWLRANIRYRIKKALNLINDGYLNYL